jgi:hypothetical protein
MSLLHRRKDDGSGSDRLTTGDVGHSQFGTPLDEILFARVDEDPSKWLYIPIGWGGGTLWADPDQWAETMGSEVWELWRERNPEAPEPDLQAVARTVVELKSYAHKYGGFRREDPFEITTYLHLPSPTVLALPVRVFVDDRPDLTAEEAAGVNAPNATEPPTVEEFSFDALGKGLKVTYYGTLDPEPGQEASAVLWVQLRYAVKIPDKQAVVTVVATDTDLGRMAGAAEDIDDFARSITVKLCN